MHPQRIPGNRDLRLFGVALAGAVVLLGAWAVPRLTGLASPGWLPWAAAAFAGLALAWPRAVYPVQRAWQPVGHAIARVTNWLLLAAVHLLLITPAGWWLRRRGRLGYRAGFDTVATTYRIDVDSQRRRDIDFEEPF